MTADEEDPLLPDAARRFLLEQSPLGHLVTLDEDGSPYVSLAWVDVDGDDLLIATLADQRKLANMRRDPRVCVSFEGTEVEPPGLRQYLVVDGIAEVTPGGAPELLRRLGERHLGPGTNFPPMPDPPEGYVTRIHVEATRGVGPWA